MSVIEQVIEAAKRGGEIALHYRSSPELIGAKTKSSADAANAGSQEGAAFLNSEVVTVADSEVEKLLRRLLPKIVNVPVYGEELGGEILDDCWVIDPIDGSTNYSLGIYEGGYGYYDTWGLLISLRRGGEVVLAAIHRPDRGDTFFAEKGHGAYVRDRLDYQTKLVLPEKISGSRITIGYGLTLDLKALSTDHVLLHEKFKEMVAGKVQSVTVRMLGATGIESMAVPSGVQTGYVSTGMYYDVAASTIITTEAGGAVTLLAEKDLKGKMIMVSSHKEIHAELVKATKLHFTGGPDLVVVGAKAVGAAKAEGK